MYIFRCSFCLEKHCTWDRYGEKSVCGLAPTVNWLWHVYIIRLVAFACLCFHRLYNLDYIIEYPLMCLLVDRRIWQLFQKLMPVSGRLAVVSFCFCLSGSRWKVSCSLYCSHNWWHKSIPYLLRMKKNLQGIYRSAKPECQCAGMKYGGKCTCSYTQTLKARYITLLHCVWPTISEEWAHFYIRLRLLQPGLISISSICLIM